MRPSNGEPRAFARRGRVVLATLSIVAGLLSVQCTNQPAPEPGSAPVSLPSTGALAPGLYFMPNPDPVCAGGCAAYHRIYFTLPAGWAARHGLVYKHLNQPGEVAFSAWTVDQVYANPCHWQGSALSSRDATGALILAPELANQALRGAGPHALTPVRLGGVGALRIDLSVPADLNISTCDKGEFRSWTEWHVVDGANSHNAPGQIDAVYMIAVDRRPLTVDASHMPAASEADLAELEAVLASMIIDY
jgi:hypothetical protein